MGTIFRTEFRARSGAFRATSLRVRAIATPILLAAAIALPGAGTAQVATSEPVSVCAQINDLSQKARDFSHTIALICYGADRQLNHPGFPGEAELAEVTLDAMARYAGALQGLPDAPTEFGAYLIAHNVGLRDALADWLTRDHVRETAALQGDNDEP